MVTGLELRLVVGLNSPTIASPHGSTLANTWSPALPPGEPVAAARLGLRVALVAAIGDDAAGNFMLAELARAGVDTGGLSVRAQLPTGMTVALSRGEGRAIPT